MKTPITYYGGKQSLLLHITPLIPEHVLYAEPFAGGAALFFAKEPSRIEVLNDTNKRLITFYRVAQSQFAKLKQRINETLHSRISFCKAKLIYQNADCFSDLDIAWAVWILSASAYNASFDGSFSYDKTRQNTTRRVINKKNTFTKNIATRLEHAQIECCDALEIIRTRDSENTFFYCDPPYFNADMGHYRGYTKKDFEQLLTALTKIKGKFLLSSYPSDVLSQFTKKNGWHTKSLAQTTPTTYKVRKPKTEVLTANYSMSSLK